MPCAVCRGVWFSCVGDDARLFHFAVCFSPFNFGCCSSFPSHRASVLFLFYYIIGLSVMYYWRSLDGAAIAFYFDQKEKRKERKKEEERKKREILYLYTLYVYSKGVGRRRRRLWVACVLIWRKAIAWRGEANRAEIERNRATAGGRRPDSVGELDRRVARGHSTEKSNTKKKKEKKSFFFFVFISTCWLRLLLLSVLSACVLCCVWVC